MTTLFGPLLEMNLMPLLYNKSPGATTSPVEGGEWNENHVVGLTSSYEMCFQHSQETKEV